MDSDIEKVVLDYFSSIFMVANLVVVHMQSVMDLIQPKVNATRNHEFMCALLGY